ncbi:lipase member M-like [Dermacentor variabilis]|uniref:lipase member M-like n=1 Tax=Dermacentor variabilis TaxID=34621 RepID=UPI003F5B86CC
MHLLNYSSTVLQAGFILADRGYDVWAMNTREIAFRSHNKNMSQKHDRYWQWSFDEIGRYDIAAVIDFVLNATGSTRVSLLGYSQGVLSSLVLFSTRPEYNDKVDILIGYAPVANVSHFRFPFPELFAFADPIFLLLDPLGNSGYFHLPQALRQVIQAICNMFKGEPCSLFLTLTLLSSPEQSNKTRMSVLLSHFLIGTSYQNLRHIVQMYRSKNFLMYDYGSSKNKELYGQRKPPAYPVERTTVPVALFSSEGDTLGNPEDVYALVDSLGSALLFNSVLPPKNFRHVDFAFGYKASGFLHGPMIDTLDETAGKGL